MKNNDIEKRELLTIIGKNLNFYRFHCNNKKIVNDKGYATIEKLAEEIDSSPNMLYNLTSESVLQGVSIFYLDIVAKALDVALFCLFLKKTMERPPKYNEEIIEIITK